jgi:leader peptidase (prepilin peptidase)/N-methyltransferase
MRTLTLPNSVVFPLMAAATLYAPWNPWLGNRWDIRLVDMVLGFLAGAGILFIFGWLGTWILGKDALGGGDIKLLGALGMVLGWQGALDGLFLGSLLSGLWGGGMILTGRLKSKSPLPYGPFLCAGCLLTTLWPNLGLSFWMVLR